MFINVNSKTELNALFGLFSLLLGLLK